jgi:prepilin-type N-terminal cleavage/methylation domain-containing protein
MKRFAFTMIELIFVIVVMGIMAKFGVELLKKVYENYARTVKATQLHEQTQTLIQQISNRLRERIPESVIVSASGNSIQWISRDTDGWNGGEWSGIADIGPLTDSNATLIETPGTNSAHFSTANDFAVYFLQNDDIPGASSFYASNTDTLHPISGFISNGTQNAFTFDSNRSIKKVSEHYIVTEHAYSISFDSTSGDLNMTRSKPWNGTTSSPFVLADNIALFTIKNFKGNAGGFIVTICMTNNDFIGEGGYRICKQKFIF